MTLQESFDVRFADLPAPGDVVGDELASAHVRANDRGRASQSLGDDREGEQEMVSWLRSRGLSAVGDPRRDLLGERLYCLGVEVQLAHGSVPTSAASCELEQGFHPACALC